MFFNLHILILFSIGAEIVVVHEMLKKESKWQQWFSYGHFILIITKLIVGNEIAEEGHGFDKQQTAENDSQHLLEKASVSVDLKEPYFEANILLIGLQI